ncbi:hypothetical protein LX32DRAFT_73426 [Colletotrichum zoysiae]|uniref:Copper acquisition factor BIM1-like domain-containing protein n=1 Tax=Colletotrichum zoysiae TaxID=1216348 RepID=A0AAD9M964_9PEZI|nr:hypothetical protein LX32DRAFT_73426 [Colletotrichum zoysiae]
MTRVLLPLLALASAATAHFSLTLPPPLSDSDETEATAPCGGFSVSSDTKTTDFHVDGDAIAMQNGHPQSNWLFRATTDLTAAGGWTQLFPVVMQTGLGNFCEPQVVVPANFTGKKGIINVVAHSPDGLLYACSAVNFVSGPAPTRSECKNATITASFTSDSSLTALVSGDAAAASGSASSSTPAASSPAPASTSPSSAAPHAAVGNLFSAGLLASVAAAVGGAAMIF